MARKKLADTVAHIVISSQFLDHTDYTCSNDTLRVRLKLLIPKLGLSYPDDLQSKIT